MTNESPPSVVGFALKVFDDEKLIHKWSLLSPQRLRRPIYGESFCLQQSFSKFPGGLLFSEVDAHEIVYTVFGVLTRGLTTHNVPLT